MSIRIAGTGSYVPEKVLTNADLEKMVETSDEWIRTRTGIQEHFNLDLSAPSADDYSGARGGKAHALSSRFRGKQSDSLYIGLLFIRILCLDDREVFYVS